MVTIVDDGLELQTKLLNGVSVDPVTKACLDSSSTAEATSQTDLVSEITTNGGAIKSATCTYEATNKAKWTVLWDFTGALTIAGYGLKNTAGTLYARHVRASPKTVGAGYSFELTRKHEITRVT